MDSQVVWQGPAQEPEVLTENCHLTSRQLLHLQAPQAVELWTELDAPGVHDDRYRPCLPGAANSQPMPTRRQYNEHPQIYCEFPRIKAGFSLSGC